MLLLDIKANNETESQPVPSGRTWDLRRTHRRLHAISLYFLAVSPSSKLDVCSAEAQDHMHPIMAGNEPQTRLRLLPEAGACLRGLQGRYAVTKLLAAVRSFEDWEKGLAIHHSTKQCLPLRIQDPSLPPHWSLPFLLVLGSACSNPNQGNRKAPIRTHNGFHTHQLEHADGKRYLVYAVPLEIAGHDDHEPDCAPKQQERERERPRLTAHGPPLARWGSPNRVVQKPASQRVRPLLTLGLSPTRMMSNRLAPTYQSIERSEGGMRSQTPPGAPRQLCRRGLPTQSRTQLPPVAFAAPWADAV